MQREAVRAILNIGTERAYRVLEQALASGTTQSREAIMQSLSAVRDERATPLFAYILRHVDHRGPLAPVYLRAIESLGALRDPEGVAPLEEALYKGEVVGAAPHAALRAAAAAALARIGTPDALAVLEEAAAGAPRGVRAVARAQLAAPRVAPARRGWDAMTAPRFQLADELLRRFAAALRSAQLYSQGAPDHRDATSRRCRPPFSCCTACSRRSSSAWSATK